MNSNALVSVIIPAYNAGRYIADTLKSVRNQTYRNLQIIVVDDGSNDTTRDVVISQKEQDERIEYAYQGNAGCSGAKNTGLQMAKGEYIQYLDADDLLSVDKIELQVAALASTTDKLAVSRTLVFQNSVQDASIEIDPQYLLSSDNPTDFLIRLYGGYDGRGGMIQPNAFLLPVAVVQKIGPWDVSLSPSPDEDGEYFCRAVLASKGVVVTGGTNYYRKIAGSGSLSNKKSHTHALGAFRSIQLKTEHLLRTENSELARTVMARQLANCAYLYGRDYPDVVDECEKELSKLGFHSFPVVGGANFIRLSRFVGFKASISILRLIKKLAR